MCFIGPRVRCSTFVEAGCDLLCRLICLKFVESVGVFLFLDLIDTVREA